MNKFEILEKLENEWVAVGHQMNEISRDFCGDYSEYLDNNECLCDLITEYGDSHIDVYNYDLLEWVKYNYTYIDDAISEFGVPEPFDFWDCIRQGQFYKYNKELISDDDNIIKGLGLLYCIDTVRKIDSIDITEESFKCFLLDISLLGIDDKLEDIKEICDKFLNNENE